MSINITGPSITDGSWLWCVDSDAERIHLSGRAPSIIEAAMDIAEQICVAKQELPAAA